MKNKHNEETKPILFIYKAIWIRIRTLEPPVIIITENNNLKYKNIITIPNYQQYFNTYIYISHFSENLIKIYGITNIIGQIIY